MRMNLIFKYVASNIIQIFLVVFVSSTFLVAIIQKNLHSLEFVFLFSLAVAVSSQIASILFLYLDGQFSSKNIAYIKKGHDKYYLSKEGLEQCYSEIKRVFPLYELTKTKNYLTIKTNKSSFSSSQIITVTLINQTDLGYKLEFNSIKKWSLLVNNFATDKWHIGRIKEVLDTLK